MEHDSNYIKEVENYFLSLAGEGIMLSSMDYNLIMEWKNKEIPKEVVFKGINNAFQDFKAKEGQGGKSSRNLKRCASYVEKSIHQYSPIIGKKNAASESFEYAENIKTFIDRLNNYTASAKDDISKTYYNNMKEILSSHINSYGEDAIARINQIEEESLNGLFLRLSDKERESITSQAREKIGNRARHMTSDALEESIVSFRNEILTKYYGLESLLSNEDVDG